jgi:hypothetical protein
MKLLLFLSCSLFLCERMEAQFLREYIFIAPTPNNGTSTAPTSFGILPAPPTPVAATTGLNNAYTAGGGLEQRFDKFFGAGLDLAGILPGTGKVIGNTVGTLSPNVYVHWPHSGWQGSKLDLYATAGYSLLFRDFTANGFNTGGGLNYWFQERLGLVVEFRLLKVVGTNPPMPASYYQIRFGLTFR